MARDIKKIVHDLTPLSGVVSELSSLILTLLTSVNDQVEFENDEVAERFSSCLIDTEKLAVSTDLIKRYIDDLGHEVE